MAKHERHKRIHVKDLSHGYANMFKQGGHYADHLAQRVVEFARYRGNDLSRLQLIAIDHYQHEPEYNIRDDSLSDDSFLRQYMKFFNDFFFFGTLTQKITIFMMVQEGHDFNWNAKTVMSENRKGGLQQLIVDNFYPTEKDIQYDIVMYPRLGIKDMVERRLQYLGTLLHEMIHVFLHCFTCDYPPCRSEFRQLGVSGHGKAWQDIALALEESVSAPKHLNLTLDLNRAACLALERVQEADKFKLMLHIHEDDLLDWKFHKRDVQDEYTRVKRQLKEKSGREVKYLGKRVIAGTVAADC